MPSSLVWDQLSWDTLSRVHSSSEGTSIHPFVSRTFDARARYEFWKKQAIDYFGVDKARENRQAIYLGAAAVAEFFADVALCPLEATRIRLVSQPDFARGLAGGFGRILREEGPMAFYAG